MGVIFACGLPRDLTRNRPGLFLDERERCRVQRRAWCLDSRLGQNFRGWMKEEEGEAHARRVARKAQESRETDPPAAKDAPLET